jgi:pimeloyl-ACP methyl ester carboxylesterase
MALLFAATRPEQVSALALYGSSPRLSRVPDWDLGWPQQQYRTLLDDAMNNLETDQNRGRSIVQRWVAPPSTRRA